VVLPHAKPRRVRGQIVRELSPRKVSD
jgi:hypothetical protein